MLHPVVAGVTPHKEGAAWGSLQRLSNRTHPAQHEPESPRRRVPPLGRFGEHLEATLGVDWVGRCGGLPHREKRDLPLLVRCDYSRLSPVDP
jgi:hypothetical protein